MSTAAILAGGRARRFGGRAKPLLPLGGRRIVDRLLAALDGVVDDAFIVANDRAAYAGLGVPVRPDVWPDAGPLGGLHAALAGSPSPRTLVVAGDMPFLCGAFLDYVLRTGRQTDVAVPRTEAGYQPLCACYPASCLGIVERRLAAGARQAQAAVAAMPRRVIDAGTIRRFDPEGLLLFNVNTPGDYARALAVAAGRDG